MGQDLRILSISKSMLASKVRAFESLIDSYMVVLHPLSQVMLARVSLVCSFLPQYFFPSELSIFSLFFFDSSIEDTFRWSKQPQLSYCVIMMWYVISSLYSSLGYFEFTGQSFKTRKLRCKFYSIQTLFFPLE